MMPATMNKIAERGNPARTSLMTEVKYAASV